MKAKEEELLENSSISNEDKALITKFVNFKVAESGITSNPQPKLLGYCGSLPCGTLMEHTIMTLRMTILWELLPQ